MIEKLAVTMSEGDLEIWHEITLPLGRARYLLGPAKCGITRGITRGHLPCWMKRFEKRNQRRCLGRV